MLELPYENRNSGVVAADRIVMFIDIITAVVGPFSNAGVVIWAIVSTCGQGIKTNKY